MNKDVKKIMLKFRLLHEISLKPSYSYELFEGLCKAAAASKFFGRSKADALFTALLPSAAENVFGHLSLLNALDLHLSGAEIVVVGEGARADALLATARKLPHGTSIVLHAPSADVLSATHPARAKLYATTDGAAFVCRGQSCSLPVTESDVLVQMVASPTATVERLDL